MRGTFKIVFGLALIVMLLASTYENANAVARPQVPSLSLVGDDGGYNKNFYPDGRLWLPTAKGEPREFLLPVFINNNWYCYYCADTTKKKYIPNPIKSFKFSLLYDSKTLRAVGVETVPPQYLNIFPEDILASNFTFDCGDQKDNYYWHYIDPVHWSTTNEKDDGRRFTIVGTSGKPLPTTPDADRGELTTSILLFVRFQVIATSEPGQTEFISKKPLYIDNREIKYNDMDVTKDRAIVEFSDYDIIEAATDYPGPSPKTLVGINNEFTTWFNTEPYKEGSIAVHFFDKLPAFDFVVNLQGVQLTNPEVGKYELTQPITIDSNCATPRYAERIVRVLNKITGTRMMYPYIYSDRDWLLFKTDRNLGEDYINNYTTKSIGDIPYIDNGLLGNGRVDPVGQETTEQRPIYLSIVADWKKLSVNPPPNPKDLEKAGMYDGTITLKAPYAEVNPVQLKVKFLFMRNPYEPKLEKQAEQVGGINLSLFNSAGQTGQRIDLVFGTGRRATSGVDMLFGEDVYNSGLSTDNFDARFFPVDPKFEVDFPALWANGFMDIAPNRYAPRTNSRDIRQYTEDQSTYVYHVKFNSGGVDKYPVVLEWDITDFPEASQLYLRDDQNGKLFQAVDMRNATQITDTRRSFTFLDSRIKDFYIEYTLPHQFTFVNEYGAAAIHQGWNMLSMPVRPLNSYYSVVYPNALNIPYHFTMNQHQQIVDGILTPGMGYFIKYSNIVDVIFKGSLITDLQYDPNNPKSDAIRVYTTDKQDPDADIDGAWNMVGGLSFPTSISGIYFKTYMAGELAPDVDFTQKFGVWKYETNQGYKEVQTIDPGYAYWIKTNRNGYYNLRLVNYPPKTSSFEIKDYAKNTASKVIVRDNAHNEGTLYLSSDININDNNFQLPPVPPVGIFDVRFNGDKYLTNATETEINLNGVQYPVALNINNADADYVFTDAIGGKVFGSISKGFTGSVIVDKALANVIKVAKQNTNNTESGFFAYPNPVESISTVNFSIPSRTNVSLKLYDITGNEVMTLANEVMETGSYTRTLDSSNLPAGSYICKLVAGTSTSFIKVTIVK